LIVAHSAAEAGDEQQIALVYSALQCQQLASVLLDTSAAEWA
jgi:hypothetical protein